MVKLCGFIVSLDIFVFSYFGLTLNKRNHHILYG